MRSSLPDNTTWNQIMVMERITMVEDPINGFDCPKEIFAEMYHSLVIQFDGEDDLLDSYVNIFFEIHPLNNSILRFQGEDEKQDFVDWAVELGIIPTIKEIEQGEDQVDVDLRKKEEQEKAQEKKSHRQNIQYQQQKNREKRRSESPFQQDYRLLCNIMKGCNCNRDKLIKIMIDRPGDPKIAKTQQKLVESKRKLQAIFWKVTAIYLKSRQQIPEYTDLVKENLEQIMMFLEDKIPAQV